MFRYRRTVKRRKTQRGAAFNLFYQCIKTLGKAVGFHGFTGIAIEMLMGSLQNEIKSIIRLFKLPANNANRDIITYDDFEQYYRSAGFFPQETQLVMSQEVKLPYTEPIPELPVEVPDFPSFDDMVSKIKLQKYHF